jgi:predicted glycoside hydrolase/deacetylase ChbG (UPF0249 family)
MPRELFIRTRRHEIKGQTLQFVRLIEKEGAGSQGRLHGAMFPEIAERVIELFEKVGVRIEREPPTPELDELIQLAHDTVEQTIEATNSQQGELF